MTKDEKYMQSALKLARRGLGYVEPNPAVGCVIVKDGKIAGRGWHKKFGQAHAEINAIEDCRKKQIDPADADMYVTLEPCCHKGKTPACTLSVIAAGIKKVFVAMKDPFSKVNGSGIEQLKKAGIEVATGLCEHQAKVLNAPFIKNISGRGSWVIIKWAQSIDGKMAWVKDSPKRWISNEKSRKDAQILRRRSDAVLVGIETAIVDDPMLTARPAGPRPLYRVVLDTDLRIPLNCHLIKTAKNHPVIIVTGPNKAKAYPEKTAQIKKMSADIMEVPLKNGFCDLSYVVNSLKSRGINHLLVEGGPKTITSFLRHGLGDELCVYISPEELTSSGCVQITEAMRQLTEGSGLYEIDMVRVDGDVKLTGLFKPVD